MDKKTWACAAFAAVFLVTSWRDAQAGAWVAAWAIALAPLAIRLLVLRAPRAVMTRAADVEALAWDGSLWDHRVPARTGGPRGGLRVAPTQQAVRPRARFAAPRAALAAR